jgi:hypothetical protein
MASLRMRRRTRVALILAILAAGLVCFDVVRRRMRPVRLDAPPPAPSLPNLSLPFDLPEDLSFVFGWNGVPAATLHVTTSRESDAAGAGIVVEYEARSLPAIQKLWHMEASGRTLLDAADLRPRHSVFRKRSESRETTYETTFDWAAGTAEISVHKVRKGKAKDKTESLLVGLDVPTAFLTLRATGAGQSIRVIQGDNAYQVVILDRGRGEVQSTGGAVEALHYEVGVRKLAGADDEEPAGEAGFSSAQIWLTPDTRAPLRLEARAPVGTVYAEPTRTAPPAEGT